MNYEVIKECMALSAEGKGSFPETVQSLLKAGVELYYADLLASSTTYYAGNTAYALNHELASKRGVADAFNADGLIAAIKQVQAGHITYQEFLKQIMDAGVVSYMVFLKGRKLVYFGRKGEQHAEEFPSKDK
jgi:uncharacterized protein YbcV (DUF1398 family)